MGDEGLPIPVESFKASSSTLETKSTCVICSSEASKCCTGCQQVYYCGLEHQKKDWKVHKKHCSPFILKTSLEFGRHYVAARRLKATSLVMEELPALCVPRGIVDDFETPLCLSCCAVMKDDVSKCRCSKCGWPVCSKDCEKNEYHSRNECEVFSKSRLRFSPQGYTLYEVYKVIEIVRGLLVKERDAKMWAEMVKLQHETELESAVLFQDLKAVREAFKLETLGKDEEWNRILGIMSVNNFTMAGQRGSPNISYEAFLFLKSSMFAHSCAPNCWWGVTVYPEYKIAVYAAVDIPKGDVISIPYTYLYSAYGTHMRQDLLKGNGDYVCKCRRCVDKTELGSFASTLKCSVCKVGLVLPVNPLESTSSWKCDDAKCENVLEHAVFSEQIEVLMKALEDCESHDDLTKYIDTNKDVTLHANHWLISEAMDTICKGELQEATSVDEDVSEKEKLIEYCSHILGIKNIVAPGISLERARLMNLIARLRFERLKLTIFNKLETNEECIAVESREILGFYEEALLFYLSDRTQTPLEKKIGLKAAIILSDIAYIKTNWVHENDDNSS